MRLWRILPKSLVPGAVHALANESDGLQARHLCALMALCGAMQSWAGSGECWAAGWIASLACVSFLQSNGNRDGPLQVLDTSTVALGCGLTSFIGALVESLPVAEIDNITVPLAVAVAGRYAF